MRRDVAHDPDILFLIGSGASSAHDSSMPRFSNLLDELRAEAFRHQKIDSRTKEKVLAALNRLPAIIGRTGDAESALIRLENHVYSRQAVPNAPPDLRTLHDLRMGIWWLINKRSSSLRGAPGPYRELAKGLKQISAKKKRWLVVNLNWDELLEDALKREGVDWFPREGLSAGASLDSLPVIKPHGSVSLIAKLQQDNRWKDLLKLGKGDGRSYVWADRPGPRPLMVFPGLAKSSNHWYLWNSRRRLDTTLQKCHTVVVIGVGLARTDGDIVRLIEHAMWHRLRDARQLDVAHIVDLSPGQRRTRVMQRLQEALRPSRIHMCANGFEAWVEEGWVDKIVGGFSS